MVMFVACGDDDQQQQKADDEQQQQEYLDALYRIEQSGVNRLDVEQLARGLGILALLHKPINEPF